MGFGAPSLKGKALQWLTQREHSRAELENKLTRYAAERQRKLALAASASEQHAGARSRGRSGPLTSRPSMGADADTGDAEALLSIESEVQRVLDELTQAGFQSDARTAETVARAQSRRYGTHRLKQALKAKGLAVELVEAAVSGARDTELQRARDIWQRRYGEPAADNAERARQMRFLAGRGFDGEVIRRVVRGAPEPD